VGHRLRTPAISPPLDTNVCWIHPPRGTVGAVDSDAPSPRTSWGRSARGAPFSDSAAGLLAQLTRALERFNAGLSQVRTSTSRPTGRSRRFFGDTLIRLTSSGACLLCANSIWMSSFGAPSWRARSVIICLLDRLAVPGQSRASADEMVPRYRASDFAVVPARRPSRATAWTS